MFEPRVPLNRLEKEIVAFEEKPIEKGLIMFYGSSGLTRWGTRFKHRPLEEDIRMKDGSQAAINHGFGSSTAEELLYYYPRAVKPWAPRALVVSIVHNDKAKGYNVNEIMTNLAKLLECARTDFPGIKLYICDARPTLKNTYQTFYDEFLQSIREYCGRHSDTQCITHRDFAALWKDPADAGKYQADLLREEMFVADQIHFNQAGYDIYKDFMLEQLDSLL